MATREWNKVFNRIARAYVNYNSQQDTGSDAAPGTSTTSLKRVMYSFMREISKGRDVPKDEACFLLAGGKLHQNSADTFKCSVTSASHEEVVEILEANTTGEETGNKNTVKYPHLFKAYKDRDLSKEQAGEAEPNPNGAIPMISLYVFAATCHGRATKKRPLVPMFMGYNDKPHWPVTEGYAKTTLTLFYPWHGSPDTMKLHIDETWPEVLERVMHTKHFPQRLAMKIYRKKNKWSFNSLGDPDLEAAEQDHSQASQRVDIDNDIAAEAAQAPPLSADGEGDADLEDALYDQLPEPDPVHDWAAQYRDGAENWLETYSAKFYSSMNERIINGEEKPLSLFDVHQYKPENARGKAQKLLVGALLYQLHEWAHHLSDPLRTRAQPGTPPPSLFMYVQGNPGSGKTYTQRTMLNIIRQVFRSMDFDMAMAPTGCAASLVNGRTSYRALMLPVGRKRNNAPSSAYMSTSSQRLQAFKLSIRSLFALFKDEHSMDTRSDWAWMEERLSSTRRYTPSLDSIPEEYLAVDPNVRSFNS